jgi:asparagine synthase (glutamine-hydrolysing)
VGVFRKTILAHRLCDDRFRMPYCDMTIRAFVRELPMEKKMKRTLFRRERKWFFKEACRPYLPEEMIRRKKGWLGSTVAEWFRSESSAPAVAMLFAKGARIAHHIDTGRLKSLLAEHRSGGANHAFTLQTALSLELWLRMIIDGEDWRDLVERLSGDRRRGGGGGGS